MKKSIVSFLILCGVLSASCTSNGDDTVTCSDTGLMWQDNADVTDSSKQKNWKNAISYCENLTLAGHNDWRLPNITELKSITDRINKVNPSLKDGFTQKSTDWFWSSATDLSDTSKAWVVFFSDGRDFWYDKTNTGYVRCTR